MPTAVIIGATIITAAITMTIITTRDIIILADTAHTDYTVAIASIVGITATNIIGMHAFIIAVITATA